MLPATTDDLKLFFFVVVASLPSDFLEQQRTSNRIKCSFKMGNFVCVWGYTSASAGRSREAVVPLES